MTQFAQWFETEILPIIANLGDPEINMVRAIAELTWDERERQRVKDIQQIGAAWNKTMMDAID